MWQTEVSHGASEKGTFSAAAGMGAGDTLPACAVPSGRNPSRPQNQAFPEHSRQDRAEHGCNEVRDGQRDASCTSQRKKVFRERGGRTGPAAAWASGVRQDRVCGGTESQGG